MTLSLGTRLGAYEVIAAIGAGGMGEVYRARDTRLGRDVALKIMPESFAGDAERLKRFEQEEQAVAALNHPNIVAIYDVGEFGGTPFLVSELLEGESLRAVLDEGALAQRRVIDYGVQIAEGLAAAHNKGIVHRDLKPENLFLTREGRVKILDFGLAKLTAKDGSGGGGGAGSGMDAVTQTSSHTAPGVVMGTVSYMAPEQVRGGAIDPRTDMFAFGAVLYEMLAGRKAFQRETGAETMTAILREYVPDLAADGKAPVAPALDRIVRRCLEKNPEDRFQSARDLSFALSALSGSGSSAASGSGAQAAQGSGAGASGRATNASSVGSLLGKEEKTKPHLLLAWIGIVWIVGAGSYFLGHYLALKGEKFPRYQALTFQRGLIHAARFTPDGHSVLYAAEWNGNKSRLFTTSPDSPESRLFYEGTASLFGISSSGELAISIGCSDLLMPMAECTGTLGRMPFSGAAPRRMADHITGADWSADGQDVAVVRRVNGGAQVEFPLGNAIARSYGWISSIRVSPRGEMIAFVDHPTLGDDAGTVVISDRRGQRKASAGPWGNVEGIAWAPSGKELWFIGDNEGWANTIRALTTSGQQRVLVRMPMVARLEDVSSDGRLLITGQTVGIQLVEHGFGHATDQDLSWLGSSSVSDISPDGSSVTFWDGSESAVSDIGFDTYVRRVDGSPPVRLGAGNLGVFSADGQWIAAASPRAHSLILLPTGSGYSKTIDGFGIQNHLAIGWLPDGKTLAFAGNETGGKWRIYLQNVEGSRPRSITSEIFPPDTYDGSTVSPDGNFVWARDNNQNGWIYPVNGGKPVAVTGLLPGDRWVSWAGDGRGAYVFAGGDLPTEIFRLEFGRDGRQPIFSVVPADLAGVTGVSAIRMARDGKSYSYSYFRILSKLMLVNGVR